MSLVFRRTVKITRARRQTGVGFSEEYAAGTRASEDLVLKDLPASIQLRRTGNKNPTGLPGDAPVSSWNIFIPESGASNGLIKVNDIVTDDKGDRYQVQGDYWNGNGYRLTCDKLKV